MREEYDDDYDGPEEEIPAAHEEHETEPQLPGSKMLMDSHDMTCAHHKMLSDLVPITKNKSVKELLGRHAEELQKMSERISHAHNEIYGEELHSGMPEEAEDAEELAEKALRAAELAHEMGAEDEAQRLLQMANRELKTSTLFDDLYENVEIH